MSRSNPTADSIPNPAQRWHEWGGEKGNIRYYDKEAKENIDVALPFIFILLDQLYTVKGWHEPSESGIVSNEVRDTRNEPMEVRAFKGGTIAEGLYKQIKDKAKSAGGHFVTNLYIAYREGSELKLGSLQFKGAALNAWVDFSKENKAEIYSKAIVIDGKKEGKKGRVVFQTPAFKLKDISEETNEEATELDRTLQTYLTGYIKRTKVEHSDPRVDAALEGVARGDAADMIGQDDASFERAPIDDEPW